MHAELDPATYGLTIWDLDREFLTGGVGRHEQHAARRHPRRAARRLLPHDRHRVHAHPGPRGAALDPGAGRGRRSRRSTRTSKRHILERLNAAEAFEKFLATKYVGTKRFGLEGAESAIPILDADPRRRPPTPASTAPCIGMAHRGRLNVLANIVGKSYDQIFKEFEGHVDPDVDAGLRRREVPPRARPASSSARSGDDITVELAANPSATSRPSTRWSMGMVRAKQDQHRPARGVLGAAAPDPRRRRVRRPGRGGRDAQP